MIYDSKRIFGAPDFDPNVENTQEIKTSSSRCFRLQAGPWPKLPQTSRPQNILAHFWSKHYLKRTKFDQAGMSKFWGLLFFRKENAGGHLGWEPRVLFLIRSGHTATKDWLTGGLACLATGWTNFQKRPDDWTPHGSK